MLPIKTTLLSFKAERAGRLPEALGPVWRGAFGSALRQQVCITGMQSCDACPLYRRCVYPYVFETPPPQDATVLRKYPHAPHPYILYPPTAGGPVAQDQPVDLEVTLIGRGIAHEAIVRSALERAAARGLGAARVPLLPTHAAELTADTSPRAVPGAVRIHLQSPLRLTVANRPVTPDRFTFGDFFSVLLRRVAMLHAFHGEAPLQLDFRGLVALARAQSVDDVQLVWTEGQRYSARQRQVIPLGGITGSFSLRGHLSPFWPILQQGQRLHVGKATVMGLGRYRLETCE